MNTAQLILAPFSWRGTINRRGYVQHAALSTALFAVGFYLQVRYEGAFAPALGLSEGETAQPLLFIPWLVELISVLGSPFTLPTMLLIMLTTAGTFSAEAAESMAATAPTTCHLLFALANLLMLIGGLRCTALAARRLRDAGSSIWRLVVLFGSLILLYAFVLHDGLPFAFVLYVLALLACLITQCRMLLRPTQTDFPPR